MAKRINGKVSPIQLSILTVFFICVGWVGSALIAFCLGYALGRSKPVQTSKSTFQIFERVGDEEPDTPLTYPMVLGDADTGVPPLDALGLETPSIPLLSGMQPSETEPEKSEPGSKAPPGSSSEGLVQDKRPELSTSGGERLLQIGSFQEREKAERLVQTLRGKNYRCFYTASGSPGSTPSPYRVFVGPFSTPDQAERVKAELEQKEGYRGLFFRPGTP